MASSSGRRLDSLLWYMHGYQIRIKADVKQRNGTNLYHELGCVVIAPAHDPDAVFS